MTIRPAVAADVPALSALATRTWSAAFGDGVDPEDEQPELAKGRSESYFGDALETKTILVAEHEGALAGYVQFGDVGIPEIEPDPADRGLDRLYVDTAHQGHGVGRLLLAAALGHLRLAEATRVFLQVWEQNDRAIRLYESVGFHRAGTTRFVVGSRPMEDLVMVLDRRSA